MAKVATVPIKLTMRTWTCDYCNQPATRRHEVLCFTHGILTCDNEIDIVRANRDINAYLHVFNLVKINDFFKMCTIINDKSIISVVRSDGSITEGGKILLDDDFGYHSFIKKASDGDWYIPVTFNTFDNSQHMKLMAIKHLTHSGVSQLVIDQIISTLDKGIYKHDYDQYEIASVNQKMQTI